MKLYKLFFFALLIVMAAPGFADHHQKVESDGYDVMIDMILRPVGIAATLIGAGAYVGVSPLTAIATIPRPHDAFVKLADTIVCKPFKWTFMRPSGDYRYNEGCAPKPRPVVYQPVPVAVPPRPVVSEPAAIPDVNKKIDTIFKREMMK
jgi:hypothetical protein